MTNQDIPTLIERFYHWEKTTPDNIFLRQPKGDDWTELTFAQAGQEVRKMVTALKQQGIKPGDHIGIFSKNCSHWILADLAIMMAGCVSVPFYASLPGDQLAEVIELGDLNAIFVGKLDDWNDGHVEVLSEGILTIKFPHYDGSPKVTCGLDWDELTGNAEPFAENYVPGLDDLWTIKFTSGTTGTPKGVMHVHRSPAMIMIDETKHDWMGITRYKQHRMFSFLPLNHVGERIGVELPAIWMGGSLSFAESLDTFVKNIKDTQPTSIFAVPRIWTNFYLGVIAKIPEKRLNLLLSIPLVSGIVKRKLKTELGLRDIKIAATGAAITPAFIKQFYHKLGIHLTEAYGMTEVCGSMTNSPMRDAPLDSVGKAIPGGAVKIDPETSEVLMQSPYMMSGYYKSPEKTAEVYKNGWLHSGDRGTMDEQGYVRVIGRVKDAFKTAKGSFITPNPLEEVLAENDYVEQVCVAGLGIPQPIALFNLSEIGQKTDRDTVAASLVASIRDLNATRANYERISTAVIMTETWSQDNDFLTPTLKVKRFNLDSAYVDQYLDWHEDEREVIWV
ncbi:MAG: AMP-binding protein [Parvibaculales bacterium]